MAYRIEDKDIVISGWEGGIAPSPYDGIADIRNMNINEVPGEAFVTFANQAFTLPPIFDEVAFTAAATGNLITIADTTGLYEKCAIFLNTNTAGGLTTNAVYYVQNLTATTFTLSVAPLDNTQINISSDGAGTFTTYQFGNQRGLTSGSDMISSYFVDAASPGLGIPGVYMTDRSNYAWFLSSTGNYTENLIFMGNIGGAGASSTSGTVIAAWEGYLLISGSGWQIANLQSLFIDDGPTVAWDNAWESNAARRGTKAIVSKEDGNLYFVTSLGVGSLIEEPGEDFDPTDGTTYTITNAALLIPIDDRSICIGELSSYLYIGGGQQYVYVWDKVSIGFNQILTIAEKYVHAIVATDQNVFMFAGYRGAVYITNSASAEEFARIPYTVTGDVMPYITFTDASVDRGQIYFSVITRTNADSTYNTQIAGVWALDINTKAMRLLNKITTSGYEQYTKMVAVRPARSITGTTQNAGNSLLVGWYVNGTNTVGLDVGTGVPYTAGEAYIDTDIIPVGTFLKPFTPKQIEWKMSVPLGGNGQAETITIQYRTNLFEAFTTVDTTTSSGVNNEGMPSISEVYTANFEKTQWLQFRIILTASATNPTYCRLTEIRVRDYPSS